MAARRRDGALVAWVLLASAAGAAERRSVLHVVADDLRTDLGFYGAADVQTPHLDALAARSLVFENAYCQQPICGPSRNSFMTGLTPQHTRVYNFVQSFRDYVPDAVSLPQFFKAQAGYVALGAGKLYHSGSPKNHDEPLSWSNAAYVDPAFHHCAKPATTFCVDDALARVEDDRTLNVSLGQLRTVARDDALFYVGAGFHRPHFPYIVPAWAAAAYANRTVAAVAPASRVADASVPDVSLIVDFELGLPNGTRYAWDPRAKPLPDAGKIAIAGAFKKIGINVAHTGVSIGSMPASKSESKSKRRSEIDRALNEHRYRKSLDNRSRIERESTENLS